MKMKNWFATLTAYEVCNKCNLVCDFYSNKHLIKHFKFNNLSHKYVPIQMYVFIESHFFFCHTCWKVNIFAYLTFRHISALNSLRLEWNYQYPTMCGEKTSCTFTPSTRLALATASFIGHVPCRHCWHKLIKSYIYITTCVYVHMYMYNMYIHILIRIYVMLGKPKRASSEMLQDCHGSVSGQRCGSS